MAEHFNNKKNVNIFSKWIEQVKMYYNKQNYLLSMEEELGNYENDLQYDLETILTPYYRYIEKWKNWNRMKSKQIEHDSHIISIMILILSDINVEYGICQLIAEYAYNSLCPYYDGYKTWRIN